MDNGGQTADQVVRMTLQGIEVAAKVSMKVGEETSKTLAATLYAILTDKKKVNTTEFIIAFRKRIKSICTP